MLNTSAVVEMFVNSTVTVSLSMFNCPFMFFLFCQCNWHHNQDMKNHKHQTNYSKQLFYLGVAIKPNFINIILGRESNGTSFDAIRSNFAQTRLE